MEVWGLIIASFALLLGTSIGIYHIYQSERNKNNLSKALIDVKTQLGEGVSKDLQALGEVTLKAIEKNGAETRSAILAVHKSIKEELGK